MTAITNSPYTDEQITAWLRGLLTIAWADGNYDPEEKELISQLTQDLALKAQVDHLNPIEPEELAQILGKEPETAENFMRTAVMVALANGVYSQAEAEAVENYSKALGLEIEALEALKHTLYKPVEETKVETEQLPCATVVEPGGIDVLSPVKKWLDDLDVKDPRLARFICKMVPPQCPFERDIKLFGKKIVHIPPLCKLNPLYEQLVDLRFRALSFLADECKEDVSEYI
ncbi:MAG: nitrogenase [Cyanobacteria bacterium J083]|nr:MAG: nitrogenase [Cyanobacteria bacterium J083]